MGAVVAVDKMGDHTALSGGVMDLAHASVLPGVLNRVSEDDVAALDVEATVEIVVVINSWGTNVVSEDIFAKLEPVVRPKQLRAHREHLVRNLEPPKFCAYLPHPLASIIVDIVSLISKEFSSCLTHVAIGPLSDHGDHILGTSKGRTTKDIAHGLALAVLNTAGNAIGNIAHKVANS